MKVRCKFQLSEVTLYPHEYRKFIFTPQYDASIPEDQRFAKASPSGKFEIMVNNPAIDWKVGEFYYFDTVAVDSAAASAGDIRVTSSDAGETQGRWISDSSGVLCAINQAPGTKYKAYVAVHLKDGSGKICGNCFAMSFEDGQLMLQVPGEVRAMGKGPLIVPMTQVVKLLEDAAAAVVS